MEDKSILTSIKKMLGIPEEYEAYDVDITIDINSVFGVLYQLSVGPKDKPYVITGKDNVWGEFIQDKNDLQTLISYMYLKVKLIFDPPTTGVLHEAMERQISEFEWRLNVQGEGEEIDGV